MNDLTFRQANKNDIEALSNLLDEIAEVHIKVRPDIFRQNAKKYTPEEIENIINDEKTPVFVAVLDGKVVGHAFCIFHIHDGEKNINDFKSLYIDDLCVEKNCRNIGIGRQFFEYIKEYAKNNGFYNIVLNVWEANTNAVKFYESLGMTTQCEHKELIL